MTERKVMRVTQAQVAGAHLRLALDKKRGRPVDPVIQSIANAKPAKPRQARPTR